jgi:hypothetical protein
LSQSRPCRWTQTESTLLVDDPIVLPLSAEERVDQVVLPLRAVRDRVNPVVCLLPTVVCLCQQHTKAKAKANNRVDPVSVSRDGQNQRQSHSSQYAKANHRINKGKRQTPGSVNSGQQQGQSTLSGCKGKRQGRPRQHTKANNRVCSDRDDSVVGLT